MRKGTPSGLITLLNPNFYAEETVEAPESPEMCEPLKTIKSESEASEKEECPPREHHPLLIGEFPLLHVHHSDKTHFPSSDLLLMNMSQRRDIEETESSNLANKIGGTGIVPLIHVRRPHQSPRDVDPGCQLLPQRMNNEGFIAELRNITVNGGNEGEEDTEGEGESNSERSMDPRDEQAIQLKRIDRQLRTHPAYDEGELEEKITGITEEVMKHNYTKIVKSLRRKTHRLEQHIKALENSAQTKTPQIRVPHTRPTREGKKTEDGGTSSEGGEGIEAMGIDQLEESLIKDIKGQLGGIQSRPLTAAEYALNQGKIRHKTSRAGAHITTPIYAEDIQQTVPPTQPKDGINKYREKGEQGEGMLAYIPYLGPNKLEANKREYLDVEDIFEIEEVIGVEADMTELQMIRDTHMQVLQQDRIDRAKAKALTEEEKSAQCLLNIMGNKMGMIEEQANKIENDLKSADNKIEEVENMFKDQEKKELMGTLLRRVQKLEKGEEHPEEEDFRVEQLLAENKVLLEEVEFYMEAHEEGRIDEETLNASISSLSSSLLESMYKQTKQGEKKLVSTREGAGGRGIVGNRNKEFVRAQEVYSNKYRDRDRDRDRDRENKDKKNKNDKNINKGGDIYKDQRPTREYNSKENNMNIGNKGNNEVLSLKEKKKQNEINKKITKAYDKMENLMKKTKDINDQIRTSAV